MKKLIMFFAIIAIFAIAFGSFSNALSGLSPGESTDLVSDSLPGDSIESTTADPITSDSSFETTEDEEHVHSYKITVAATCTTSGTKTCSCGATQTISALGHDFDPTSGDCKTKVECTQCGLWNGGYGPHKDYNGDNKCDYCNTSM